MCFTLTVKTYVFILKTGRVFGAGICDCVIIWFSRTKCPTHSKTSMISVDDVEIWVFRLALG